MKRDIKVYFDDIIESIVFIEGYTKDVNESIRQVFKIKRVKNI